MTRCGFLHCLLLIASACGGDELKFSLPDAGPGRADGGDNAGGALTSAALDPSSTGPWPRADEDLLTADASSADQRTADEDASGNPFDHWAFDDLPVELFDIDPAGEPTTDDQRPPWCGQGGYQEELCGNEVDEDCDGIVDEFAGIAEPCMAGCGEGLYACDRRSNHLICQGRQGCAQEQPPSCGDGFVQSEEQCDHGQPGEIQGVTCTPDCRRPLFVRCVVDDGQMLDVCDDRLRQCNAWVGACVPFVSAVQPRCPNIPVEQHPDFVYPMVEVDVGDYDDQLPRQCWVSCTEDDQCPSSLPDCYMGFCVVRL